MVSVPAGLLGLAACHGTLTSTPDSVSVASLPVRFLITFDDGPSGEAEENSTARILDTLAHNRWQNGIKAIFFVQTRHRFGGGTEVGQSLLRRMQREGHQLALHTATARGHINHTQMPLVELDRMLDDGIDDIRRVSGDVPGFIRPPFWAYNSATLARYEAHGLSMLLDDITIRDGKARGVTANPHARERIHTDLQRAAHHIQSGAIPSVSGYIPLVMTMHDTNPTTAQDLELYLGMLIEEARRVGLVVHRQPFIAPVAEVVRVANLRASRAVVARIEGNRRYP